MLFYELEKVNQNEGHIVYFWSLDRVTCIAKLVKEQYHYNVC